MTTGCTEKFKAAWFKVSHTRSYTNILDIIGGVDDVNLNTITADGYTGYPQKSVIHNFNSTRSPIKYAA